MVWSIIGWTLLGLLGLFVLALLLPAVAYLDYRAGELSIKVRVLFVKLRLFPFKEKPEGKKRKKRRPKKKKAEEKPEKPKEPKSLEEKLALLKRILSSVGVGTRFLLRFMRITGFEFQAAVNTGDAADTAILYGRLQGVVAALHALLENLFTIRFKRMVLIPDFGGEHPDSLILSCKVSAPPVIMLIAAIKGFSEFLTYNKKNQPARPAAQPAAPGPQRSNTDGE